MDIYAVAGPDGAGKTATALNVAVAFRTGGRYAAVLDADIEGNVTTLLDIDPERTLDEVLDGDATLREATTEYELSPERVPETDLQAYHEALAEDRRAFRSAEQEFPGIEETSFPEVDSVPVIAGWPSERRIAATDPAELEGLLQELVMAYDAIVVDTGGESVAATAPVAVADGVAIVTSPAEPHVGTANAMAGECQRNGAPLIGTVVNRATDETSITALTEEVGLEAVGVVPADERTPTLEPVRYAVPDAPVASAYDRLADSLAEWGESVAAEASSAADGGGPEASTASDADAGGSDAGDTEETQNADGADASGEDDDAGDDDEGGGGLLGRLRDLD